MNEQAILNLQYQTALTMQQAADENLAAAKFKARSMHLTIDALKLARHALATVSGMIATDIPGTVADTDANKNLCFTIDHENEIAAIDEALSTL